MRTVEQIWPHLVYNDSGVFIPPFGCVRITGVVESDRGKAQYNVDLPRGPEAGAPANVDDAYLFVGPQGVAAGQYGNATAALPAPVAHVGVPSFGASWGPITGQFEIGASGNGYRVLGASVRGVVMVGPIDQRGGGTGEVVRVYNDSQLTRVRGNITRIKSPLNIEVNNQNPADDTLFTRPVLFTYDLPVAKEPFAILLEDCEYEATVDAVCVGVVAVKIDYTDAAHTRADCEDDEGEFLTSGTTGRVAILWREFQDRTGPTGLGEQWALVYFDGGGGGGELASAYGRVDEAAPIGGRGRCTLYILEDGDELKVAVPDPGLTTEERQKWDLKYRPYFSNPYKRVQVIAGVDVVLSAVEKQNTTGGGGGVEDDGRTFGFIGTYADVADYLTQLPEFAPNTHLVTRGSEAADIEWATDDNGGSGGDCETIQVVTDVTCNNGSLNVTKGSISVITCDPNGGVP